MERPADRFSVNRLLTRNTRYWWITIELEWKILAGQKSSQILQKIQGNLRGRNINSGNFWKIRSFSCLCSTILIGHEKIWREMYSKFRRRQDLREEILVRTLEVSRSWRWKEMLWNMETAITNLTENGIPSLQRWNYDPRKQDIQSLRVSASWIVESWEEWKKRNHTFTADVSIKEFLFRIIHSVNKLSIYGAVSNWSGQHGQSLNETESFWEKFNDERRLRESGNTEEYEFTGSKLFREFFVIESCFWKQIVRGSSEFCFSTRIHSNYQKKLRTSIILEFEDSWYVS